MHLETLITHYGYIIVLIGTFLEGETILVLAGFLASRGYLSLPWVIAAAFAGTVSGDQLFYFIGRIKGIAFLNNHPTLKAKSSRARRLLRQYKNWIILGFRFIYGIRTVTPFLIGASGIPGLRFAILNIISAAAWAVAIGCLGYVFGQTVEIVLANAKRYELILIAVIIAAGFLFWLRNLYITWKKAKFNNSNDLNG